MSRRIEDLSFDIQKMTKDFLTECDKRGVRVFLTCGLRTFEEQQALHAQGRKSIDEVNKLRDRAGMDFILNEQNKVVTNAEAGYSPHNFGRAIDVAFWWDKNNDGKIQPGEVGWDGDWDKVGCVGEEVGFVWGGRWRTNTFPNGDKPHFEFLGTYTLALLRESYLVKLKGKTNV